MAFDFHIIFCLSEWFRKLFVEFRKEIVFTVLEILNTVAYIVVGPGSIAMCIVVNFIHETKIYEIAVLFLF